jgi:hypothetical protein
MTAAAVRITHRVTPGGGNPSRAYGQHVQAATAPVWYMYPIERHPAGSERQPNPMYVSANPTSSLGLSSSSAATTPSCPPRAAATSGVPNIASSALQSTPAERVRTVVRTPLAVSNRCFYRTRRVDRTRAVGDRTVEEKNRRLGHTAWVVWFFVFGAWVGGGCGVSDGEAYLLLGERRPCRRAPPRRRRPALPRPLAYPPSFDVVGQPPGFALALFSMNDLWSATACLPSSSADAAGFFAR